MSESGDAGGALQRALRAFRSEIAGFHPRLFFFDLAGAVLPRAGASEVRALLLDWVGFQIGPRTRVGVAPRITGRAGLFERLTIGADANIDADCVFDLEDRIRIGDRVTISPGVMILTSTHELASAQHRAGPVTIAPVTIEDGAWLRARSIILPGVTVGAGAIVEVGAVVNKDVPPNTRVGGVPAVALETLEKERE
jgi:maltose O-acetyltransferase